MLPSSNYEKGFTKQWSRQLPENGTILPDAQSVSSDNQSSWVVPRLYETVIIHKQKMSPELMQSLINILCTRIIKRKVSENNLLRKVFYLLVTFPLALLMS